MTPEEAAAVLRAAGYSEQEIHDLSVRGQLVETAYNVRARRRAGDVGQQDIVEIGGGYAVNRLGFVLQQDITGNWVATGGSVTDEQYGRIFGGVAGTPDIIGGQTGGYYSVVPDPTQPGGVRLVPLGGATGGGGGGAGPGPSWGAPFQIDDGSWWTFDQQTGVPRQLDIPRGAQMLTLGPNQSVVERDPATGELKVLYEGGSEQQAIVAGHAIYTFDPRTGAVTQAATLGPAQMSPYEQAQVNLTRQQMALEWYDRGYGPVGTGTSQGGVTVTPQIGPSAEQPVTFEAKRSVGGQPVELPPSSLRPKLVGGQWVDEPTGRTLTQDEINVLTAKGFAARPRGQQLKVPEPPSYESVGERRRRRPPPEGVSLRNLGLMGF